jgi:hypothetical protein
VIVPPSWTSTVTWSPAFRCARSINAASRINPDELPIFEIVLTLMSNYVLQRGAVKQVGQKGPWEQSAVAASPGLVRPLQIQEVLQFMKDEKPSRILLFTGVVAAMVVLVWQARMITELRAQVVE